MKTYAGNLKKGDFISYQSDIWQVMKAEFYSPGKGSALMRAKIKNLVSGKNIDYSFKSNEDVETLEVSSVEMQYLYKDVENLYFMDERSYNQYTVPMSVGGDIAPYLKEGDKIYVYLHNDKPLTLRPPMSVRLKVVETEDAAKGDTVSGAKKPAIMETGVTVMVPIFVKVGEIITVNPETAEYTGRSND
ncbi:elongation factor P [Candidatus Roizmanbacteria bacterium]|nr:elongation factor P [Candidatus Roizmanbacteria bacterium]